MSDAPNEETGDVRSIRDQHWCWMPKAVLFEYARDIGAAGIAVYMCLAAFVDDHQTCYPTQDQIGSILGYSRVSISKVIGILRDHGLIAVEKQGRYNCTYRLLRVRRHPTRRQMSPPVTSDVKQSNTNENHTSRFNIDTTDRTELVHSPLAIQGNDLIHPMGPETLALELAEALCDHQHLSFYRLLTRRHSDSVLRTTLRDVLAVPQHRIRKSRAALFIHLVKSYGKQDNHS